MKSRITTVLLLILFPVLGMKAQNGQTADTVYTLEDCYALVSRNYPLVKRYELIRLTEEYSLKNAYMHYFPQIALKGSASYQTDVLAFPELPFEIPGFSFPTFSKDQYAAIVELSQVLWDGGMIAAERENIRAKAEIEKEQHKTDLYSLRKKINDLYFGILLLKEQLLQLDLMVENLDIQMKRIRDCIANGIANESDLDILKVEKITRKQNRDNITSLTETYLRMLTLMTGTRIDRAEMLTAPLAEGIDREQLLTRLIVGEIRRPELKVFDARLKEIETQLDYWTAGGLPQFRIFLKGGYGRPGLNMMSNDFSFYAVGGIQLVWNISELYSLGYGKKIVRHSKAQIETMRETFLFNTRLQSEEQIAEVRRYLQLVEDDKDIVALRTRIRISTEKEVENGTKNTSDLISEINKEDAASRQQSLHEIELMKALYELKTIKNN